ncbi:MAG: tRNA preQ1(34) S-adenosylmethionine ribosyltransferase-isomerase QueA [Coriobacteriia bacterium]|nr:tRNA preQ1(34) S-adenosylmethionine ribosyltransferase-isomerase QueA [Coriobacteriia bacterium]
MRTDDFDYELPAELIAQTPAEPRDSCRLLVLDRETGACEHRRFTDILDYLNPGDLLVVNETRVLPARLRGMRAGGGAAELLLLRQEDKAGAAWECLARPGKRIRSGDTLSFGDGRLTAEITQRRDAGRRLVRFSATAPGDTVSAALHAIGETPLPPYITRTVDDPELYQTVYANAEDEHSAAAPTAGLHFTPELLQAAQDRGIGLAKLRLDVGLDTFRPVTEDDPAEHAIHTEYYYVSPEAAAAINATRARGNRIIAVGTTVVRALESAALSAPKLAAFDGPSWAVNPSHSASPSLSVSNQDAGDQRGGGIADTEHSADSQSSARAQLNNRVEDATVGDAASPLISSVGGPTSLYILPGFNFRVVDALITNFHVPRSTLVMLVSAFASREHILAAYREAVTQRYRFFSFGDAMLIR